MSNSFSDAVREALAKKQATSLPQGKKTKNKDNIECEQERQKEGIPIALAQMPQHFFIVPSKLLRLSVLVPASMVRL